ncbi:uncharacterized protein SPSK_04046 [Sporothrix schenckii 1099-18]|uniref:DUF7918 domain-containing protein n=2 Tax=Sporothrix schenckii TaxID=29908 RepID=U7PUL7_SPOS1|nr:uncharacterized protein SPSK_04046 [Sporothrix schenckii 1099-18]ERS99297.1 hypothetical protein HMPREF1624_04496 [Sporothrix schenckii ATCC 58251]KJR82999.1 hypothetical protein SPSK_04046 [Sporothrix schenckii 1099-18]
MPCFKGIAVSIHANGAPLPEHGIQKQSRVSRINSYIPVPQPQLSTDSGKPEAAKFAISITLLTPGLPIPYSTPKASDANPYPKPHVVGELPSSGSDSKFAGIVTPYIPMTNSENETIAAYIYFDGRAKEEVATLLRPGEETWVNSRWVQVPETEGGGLAEREFLFREVGLERWLNGLDLEGHDAAAKLEKRRQRFEKRRRRQELQQKQQQQQQQNGSSTNTSNHRRKSSTSRDLRYGGADAQSPVEALEDDDLSDDSVSSDDELPEATGQIKVAMFRVLASGEIKKGEYSPQFDAHDDDDAEGGGNGGSGVDADVEHTTSFAKPKTLDPKTISTQTVTGIDGPDKPYAVFTFFYRGERQLSKMGIIPSAKGAQQTATDAKRKSAQLDFSSIGPLKTAGTVGFSTFRDNDADPTRQKKAGHKRNGSVANTNATTNTMDEDSDEDDEDDDKILGKMDDADDKDGGKSSDRLTPEDAQFSGELADGVNRIRLKRQHSVDPDSAAASSNAARKSPSTGPFGGELTPTEGSGATPSASGLASGVASAVSGGTGGSVSGGDGSVLGTSANSGLLYGKGLPDDTVIGSPLKRHRASVAEGSEADPRSVFNSGAFPPALGDILAKAEAAYNRPGQSGSQSGSGLGAALGGSLGTSPSPAAAGSATTAPALKEEDEEEL